MSLLNDASLHLARELIAVETARAQRGRTGVAREAQGTGGTVGAVGAVAGKLGRVLVPYVGEAGFRGLLRRALTLAKRKHPSLAEVRVEENGTLSGLTPAAGRQPADRKPGGAPGKESGEEAIIAGMIELTAVFIGESLTLALLREAWPRLSERARRPRKEEDS